MHLPSARGGERDVCVNADDKTHHIAAIFQIGHDDNRHARVSQSVAVWMLGSTCNNHLICVPDIVRLEEHLADAPTKSCVFAAWKTLMLAKLMHWFDRIHIVWLCTWNSIYLTSSMLEVLFPARLFGAAQSLQSLRMSLRIAFPTEQPLRYSESLVCILRPWMEKYCQTKVQQRLDSPLRDSKWNDLSCTQIHTHDLQTETSQHSLQSKILSCSNIQVLTSGHYILEYIYWLEWSASVRLHACVQAKISIRVRVRAISYSQTQVKTSRNIAIEW